MSNLIKSMKEQIAKSGSSKKEILYFAPDSTKRIRFLQELDAGTQMEFHSDWNTSLFVRCKDPEDHENCEYCENGIGIQNHFVWSVWDYDSNSVKLIMFKATGVTPVPAFIEMYEEFGTIMDRDYKVKKVGKGTGGSFVVTPLDKERFKNSKAKPFDYHSIVEIMDKAWTDNSKAADDDEAEEDDENEKEVSKKDTKKKGKKKLSLREKFENLSLSELKEIGEGLGMKKKEMKGMDEDDLIDEFFDNYEESDLEELYEDLGIEEDE